MWLDVLQDRKNEEAEKTKKGGKKQGSKRRSMKEAKKNRAV